jgi:hypothetical protein
MSILGDAMKLIISIILLGSQLSWGAATRTIDADTIRSSDATKSYNVFTQVPVGASLIQEVPSGTVNGSNQSFTISYSPVSTASVMLYLDGMLQKQTTDYTISGSSISIVTAPAAGQSLLVIYSRY